MQYSSTEFWLC